MEKSLLLFMIHRALSQKSKPVIESTRKRVSLDIYKDLIFLRILNKESPMSIAKEYGASSQAVMSSFWKTFLKIRYCKDKIDFEAYYSVARRSSVPVQHSITELQESKEYWKKELESLAVIESNSKLIQLDIAIEHYATLVSNNIVTVNDYINTDTKYLMSLFGIGKGTLKKLNESLRGKV